LRDRTNCVPTALMRCDCMQCQPVNDTTTLSSGDLSMRQIMSIAVFALLLGSWTPARARLSSAPDAVTLVSPTIALSFNPQSIVPNAMTTLTVTLSNPNADGVQLNSPDVTITGLPGGATLTVSGSNPTIACSDGSGANDPPIVVPANGSCTLVFANISGGSTDGSYTATWPANVQFVDSADETNSVNTTDPSTATLDVGTLQLQAPTITLAFNPTSVAANATTTLTATLSNPNSDSVQLNTSDVAITGLPGGAMLSVPGSNPTIACSDGSGASDPPIDIPADGTCTLTFVHVSAGTTAGNYTATWPSNLQFVDVDDQ